MSLLQLPLLNNEQDDFKASIEYSVTLTPPKGKNGQNTCNFKVGWSFGIDPRGQSNEYESTSIIDTLGFIGGVEQIFSTVASLILGAYSELVFTLATIKKLYDLHVRTPLGLQEDDNDEEENVSAPSSTCSNLCSLLCRTWCSCFSCLC